jgi:2-dehydro-3-deoxyphosphooctonate aldolase (KDO 8-P synthase)
VLFDRDKLLVIAGPCVIESEGLLLDVAERLAQIAESNDSIRLIFKASFDKANRTSVASKRGVGLVKGLEIFRKIKEKYGFIITTDIHLPEQAVVVASVCDVLQIPAFLCRQTDLLVSAAKTGAVVSVKKGQFLSAREMRYVIDKLEVSGAEEVWQIERGTTFGYNDLVVDMRNIGIMKSHGAPVIFDATHSVQKPGAGEGVTIGNREFVETLAYGAMAAGADGVFFETHMDPDQAACDAANQVDVNKIERIIGNCVKFWELRRSMVSQY